MENKGVKFCHKNRLNSSLKQLTTLFVVLHNKFSCSCAIKSTQDDEQESGEPWSKGNRSIDQNRYKVRY